MAGAKPGTGSDGPTARRELLRELALARASARAARQRGDRDAERRARSRLLVVYSALLRRTE